MAVEIIAQILGFVAVILGFLSYQVKGAKALLVVHGITCAIFSVHYIMLGAVSGAVLNITGIVRDIAYYHKDKKPCFEVIFPVAFSLIMLVLGVLSWQGIHSLLVVSGMVIHTACLAFKSPQNIRKSILITSPLVLLYDCFEWSIGGVIYESVAIISSIIGIVRFSRKENRYEQNSRNV